MLTRSQETFYWIGTSYTSDVSPSTSAASTTCTTGPSIVLTFLASRYIITPANKLTPHPTLIKAPVLQVGRSIDPIIPPHYSYHHHLNNVFSTIIQTTKLNFRNLVTGATSPVNFTGFSLPFALGILTYQAGGRNQALFCSYNLLITYRSFFTPTFINQYKSLNLQGDPKTP
jgi:hypothetical protein